MQPLRFVMRQTSGCHRLQTCSTWADNRPEIRDQVLFVVPLESWIGSARSATSGSRRFIGVLAVTGRLMGQSEGRQTKALYRTSARRGAL